MSDPKNIGNQADEQAEFDAGADFAGVNALRDPGHVEPITVDHERVEEGFLLIPTRPVSEDFRRGVGELQESAKDITAAQLFEDPLMITPYAHANLAKRKSERGALIYYGIRPTIATAPFGDRIIIEQDTIESAYSCRYCHGRGHTEAQCPTCKGTSIDIDGESPCRSCKVIGYSRASGHGDETWYPCGHVVCEFCRGVGWPGGIILPEVAQNEPACGIVVTVGPQCVNVFPGDRILFSKWSGHTMSTPEKNKYITMHEHEVLQLIKEIKPKYIPKGENGS